MHNRAWADQMPEQLVKTCNQVYPVGKKNKKQRTKNIFPTVNFHPEPYCGIPDSVTGWFFFSLASFCGSICVRRVRLSWKGDREVCPLCCLKPALCRQVQTSLLLHIYRYFPFQNQAVKMQRHWWAIWKRVLQADSLPGGLYLFKLRAALCLQNCCRTCCDK